MIKLTTLHSSGHVVIGLISHLERCLTINKVLYNRFGSSYVNQTQDKIQIKIYLTFYCYQLLIIIRVNYVSFHSQITTEFQIYTALNLYHCFNLLNCFSTPVVNTVFSSILQTAAKLIFLKSTMTIMPQKLTVAS